METGRLPGFWIEVSGPKRNYTKAYGVTASPTPRRTGC